MATEIPTKAEPMVKQPGKVPACGDDFAAAPVGWHCLGSVRELAAGPIKFVLPGEREYVAYRTASGAFAVLGARCAHMRADLANGCVHGENIVCPLHAWEFGPDGRCAHIPTTTGIPAFARQPSYPVVERGGQVFFFNRPHARFPMPFFDGLEPEALCPAPPFFLQEDAPWYMLAANGFDLQHFRNAHDRVLLDEPVVDSPAPFARRIRVRLRVAGNSLTDRLTRLLAGDESEMTVTVWTGCLIFVEARFRRTTTYGMVCVLPLPSSSMRARVVVSVRRSRNHLLRWLADPVLARVRRKFIRVFLEADLGRLSGVRFDRKRMIAEDRVLTDYIDWLHEHHR